MTVRREEIDMNQSDAGTIQESQQFVAYRHYRPFVYLRGEEWCGGSPSPKGGATVCAACKDPEGSSKATIWIGATSCHSKADVFCKKTGREESLRRANTDPIAMIVVEPGNLAEQVMRSIMRDPSLHLVLIGKAKAKHANSQAKIPPEPPMPKQKSAEMTLDEALSRGRGLTTAESYSAARAVYKAVKPLCVSAESKLGGWSLFDWVRVYRRGETPQELASKWDASFEETR